jgi:hypothetical protein
MEAHLLAQVPADHVVLVADAVRVRRRRRVQQDARGVDATGAHHDDLAEHLAFGTGVAVEVLHASREPLVIDQHARHHRVAADLQLAGLHGVGEEMVGRAEERGRVAAAAALAAVMAGGKPVVGHRLHGAANAHERHPQPLAGARQRDFGTAHLRRRQEVPAPRQRVVVIVAATHADQLIDLVVVGRHVGVVDGPGDVPAIDLAGPEVHLRVAQADASPHVGLAADAPHANQLEVLIGGREIGLFLRVEEELIRQLTARPTLARFGSAHVRPVLRAIELAARVEQQHVDALPREVPRRHATRRAGADDDDRVDLGGGLDEHVGILVMLHASCFMTHDS